MVQETRPGVTRRWPTRWLVGAVVLVALGLVASIGLIWIHHDGGEKVDAADRGRLTPHQYAAAVRVARAEIAETHGKVSAAVATIVKARPSDCNADAMLVVQLVGLDIPVGAPEHPTGPDEWVTIRANPADGQACSTGVGLGRFTAPPGAADLMPAL